MEKQFIMRPDYPVVETKAGKLRGYVYDGVFRFYGIKYADAKRFQMPTSVEKWEGIKDAQDYGYNCPGSALPRTVPHGEAMTPHRFYPESEHCQYLNVWTNSIDKDAKKPVMVWLHGGGFMDGSAIEMQVYDGDNLAKHNDVVCVTLNHRLNVLGFLDLSEYGPEYENSGNVGMADIVAALQWVKENIANFGGDPERVMIFGQSGGGGKVSALMQIPAAEGLFQRAVVMSGIIPDDNMLTHTTAPGKVIAEEIIKELGPDADFNTLLTAPEYILERATSRAEANIIEKGYAIGWGPRKNGWYMGSLCLSEICEYSKKIPVIVGTAFAEFGPENLMIDRAALTEEEREKIGGKKYGRKRKTYMKLFKEAYPDVNASYAGDVDTFFRKDTMDYVLKKAGESEAPVYNYVFAIESPMNGGTIAPHCADIPFAFHNAELAPAWNIPGVSDAMNENFSKMMAHFAATGDPNIPEFPTWEPCTGEHIRTMIFDRETVCREEHDKKLVEYIVKNTPKMWPDFYHDKEKPGTYYF